MAIKSRGWTRLTAVKIVSFTLIILLAFAFLSNVFFTERQFDNNNIDLDIVFANFSGNDLFYRSSMDETLNDLQSLLFLKNEDNIKQGNCIRWVRREDGDFWLESSDGTRTWSNSGVTSYAAGDVIVSNGEFAVSWGEAQYSSAGNEQQYTEEQIQLQRESMEKGAINEQLQVFRELKKRLDSRHGLVFFASKDGVEYSNTDDRSLEFFMRQPLFTIIENGFCIAQSNNMHISPMGDSTVYLGYTAEAIDTYNRMWQSRQSVIIRRISATIGIMVLAFALFVTLLCGAGRKRGSDTIHFNVLDKPYLDIGLSLVFLYELAVGAVLASVSGDVVYGYTHSGYYDGYGRAIDSSNTRGVLILLAAAAALMLPPALYYVMSFAKRVKAGNWWRHTLVWRIWNAIWSRCVSFAKSLWAGVPLTLKVGLICFCLFCVMLIVAASGNARSGDVAIAMAFASALVLAVPMLRYAKRLCKLTSGAKAASEGVYGVIDVHGGELGKIAGYVNNISAGIEAAVDERLKSERLKTELITNVSHDIRTPLTSLITYTDLLKSEGLASEKAPEYLDILIQKSQRLKTLTDELFEAAKASTGNIETHLETLDFAALMRQVLGELDERIQESGLELRLNLPERAWVTADGKLLWRVVENLLSNVFKYTLPQSRVYIDLVSEGGEARLDIKNISAQPLNVDPSELTERFKRGDESRSSEGSGLGLSIVQSFIEAQNGRFKLAIDGDLFKASVYMPAV